MQFSFKIENIKYVKVSCTDSNNNIVAFKTGIKEINDRYILIAAKNEQEISIPTPQNITFNVVCVEGLYTTFTKLLRVEYREEFIYLTLELPKTCEYQQNREYFRVDNVYPCEYIMEKDEETKIINTETINISANGVTIFTNTLEVSETSNKLKININGTIIETDVDFVRSEKLDNGYSMAFQYIDIKESYRDLISKECLKKQLESRGKYRSL